MTNGITAPEVEMQNDEIPVNSSLLAIPFVVIIIAWHLAAYSMALIEEMSEMSSRIVPDSGALRHRSGIRPHR